MCTLPDLILAFQLWLRVNVAAGGTDYKAIKAFQRLANKQSPSSPPTPTPSNPKGDKVELLSAKGIKNGGNQPWNY